MKIKTLALTLMTMTACGTDESASEASGLEGPFRTTGAYETDNYEYGEYTCARLLSFRDLGELRQGTVCVNSDDVIMDYRRVAYSLESGNVIAFGAETFVSCPETEGINVGVKTTYSLGENSNSMVLGGYSYSFIPDDNTEPSNTTIRGGCISENEDGTLNFEHNPEWTMPQ